MNPEYTMYLGIGVGVLSIFGPTIYEKAKPIVEKLNPSNWGSVSGLDKYSIHEVLENLLGRYRQKNDEEGITLVASLGKHAYDNCHVKSETKDE